MSLVVNIYCTGENGNARKFAEEMVSSGVVNQISQNPMMEKIVTLHDKYHLRMKVAKFFSASFQ